MQILWCDFRVSTKIRKYPKVMSSVHGAWISFQLFHLFFSKFEIVVWQYQIEWSIFFVGVGKECAHRHYRKFFTSIAVLILLIAEIPNCKVCANCQATLLVANLSLQWLEDDVLVRTPIFRQLYNPMCVVMYVWEWCFKKTGAQT